MARSQPHHSLVRRVVRLEYRVDRFLVHLGDPAYDAEWDRICAESDALNEELTEAQQLLVHDFHVWVRRQYPPPTPEDLQRRAELWAQSEWLS